MIKIFGGENAKNGKKCKHCRWLFRVRTDLSHFYCTKMRSNRTYSGYLKRKYNDSACDVYFKEDL